MSYLYVIKTTRYTTWVGTFQPLVFELTPLGLIAPLFGYPHEDVVFNGKFNIKTDIPEATSRISDLLQFSIQGKEGSQLVDLDFNRGFIGELEENGYAVRYTPDRIQFSVSCGGLTCSVAANPDVADPDGIIHLKSQLVVDKKRLAEIKKAEKESRLAEEKAVTQERKRRAQAAQLERQIADLQAKNCPDLAIELTALRGAAAVAVSMVGTQEVLNQINAKTAEFNSYNCLPWLVSQHLLFLIK